MYYRHAVLQKHKYHDQRRPNSHIVGKFRGRKLLRNKNFHKWVEIHKICESFLPRKFPAIQYIYLRQLCKCIVQIGKEEYTMYSRVCVLQACSFAKTLCHDQRCPNLGVYSFVHRSVLEHFGGSCVMSMCSIIAGNCGQCPN